MNCNRRIRGTALSLLITSFISIPACSKSPVESESLSSEAHSGKKSLRVSAFGVLTPGQTKQKIMVEDSRNNVMERYTSNAIMDVAGSLSDQEKVYTLNRSGFVIADPFQMPQIYGTQQDIDDEIREAEADAAITEDYSLVEYLEELKGAVAMGLTRYVIWFTTEAVTVEEGETYGLELKILDRAYPDIDITIRDSTNVPGGFEFVYPKNGETIKSEEVLQLRWTASDNAAGYRIIADTPLNSYKKFEAAVAHNAFDIPQFFKEKAPYRIQIWALDANYFRFLNQCLEQQRVNRTHFFDYGEMNLSALVVFGSRVMRSVEFTVE